MYLSVANQMLYGAVGFLIGQWLFDFTFELRCIWSKPWSSIVKWRYLWSRYIGLVAQFLFSLFYLSVQSLDEIPLSFCRSFHGFAVLMWETLLISLMVGLRNLMLPLHDEHPRLRTALLAISCLEFCICFVWTTSISQRLEVKGACLIRNVPYDTMYYSFVRLGFFAALWFIGCCCTDRARPKLWRTTARYVFPAFTTMFALFIALIISSGVTTLYKGLPFDPTAFFQCLFPVGNVVIASLNCYLIKTTETRALSAASRTVTPTRATTTTTTTTTTPPAPTPPAQTTIPTTPTPPTTTADDAIVPLPPTPLDTNDCPPC